MKFGFHFLKQSALVAILHENVKVFLTPALERIYFDQVGMVRDVFENLYLVVDGLFIILVAVMGNDFDSKFIKLLRLFVGLLDGAKAANTKLLIVQNDELKGRSFEIGTRNEFSLVLHQI